MFKFLIRAVRPTPKELTALEQAVQEFEEVQRRQLYYKREYEDAAGSALVVEGRIDRLRLDIKRLVNEKLPDAVSLEEARKQSKVPVKQSALQMAREQLQQDQRDLLTFHSEREAAEHMVAMLNARSSRLKDSIMQLASEQAKENLLESNPLSTREDPALVRSRYDVVKKDSLSATFPMGRTTANASGL